MYSLNALKLQKITRIITEACKPASVGSSPEPAEADAARRPPLVAAGGTSMPPAEGSLTAKNKFKHMLKQSGNNVFLAQTHAGMAQEFKQSREASG